MTVPRNHARAIGLIRSNEPDLVVVMLGTNDLTGGLSAEQIAERMEAFLDSISSLGRTVLLIAPPVLQYGEWVMDDDIIEESGRLGDIYRELAERKGCLFADAGKWGIEMAFDGVHFSPEGHSVFAEHMNNLLQENQL
jgi:lysophospholipase L1-like esterase